MKPVQCDGDGARTCWFLYSSQYIISYVVHNRHKFVLHYIMGCKGSMIEIQVTYILQ
jgi:hypothetical protein